MFKRNNKWTQQEIEFLRLNYSNTSSNDLKKYFFNRTFKSIQHMASNLKLKKSKIGKQLSFLNRKKSNKYFANYTYFDIPNIQNCYWAGFIAADGCIRYGLRNNKELCLAISIKDKKHLEKFKRDINYSGPIYERKRGISNMVTIGISSSYLVNILEKNFSITRAKSLTLQPPQLIDKDLILSYIKGYIDGDGSISISKKRQLKLHIVSGSCDILQWIVNFLHSNYSPSAHGYPKIIKSNRGNYYDYNASGTFAISYLSDMLKLKTRRLNRKWARMRLCQRWKRIKSVK